jgi:hypothetical protein
MTIINYYQFTPCCEGLEILFFAGDGSLATPATYEYERKCYNVTYVLEPFPGILPPVPVDELTLQTDCSVPECACCQCIRVRTRDVLPIPSLNVSLVTCNNKGILFPVPGDMTWSEKQCVSAWTIDQSIFEIEIIGDCISDGLPPVDCSEHRVTIPTDTPSGTISYIDCAGVAQVITYPFAGTTLYYTFCALSSEPVVTIGIDDIIGDCSTPQYDCPIETCFLLEDCDGVEEDIYASYTSMSAYIATGNIIKIDGFPTTCWTYTQVDECECQIEVTVLTTWVSCEECQTCQGYKLTNCEDDAYIKYTTNDLSAYIDKAVEFADCPGCWLVECMDVAPPNDQNLTVTYSFENCIECLSTFWKLTPCVGEGASIFTDTDLSAYLGFLITLDGIADTCWSIEEVRDLEGVTFETVFVNTQYAECEECLIDILKCQCSSAVNASLSSTPLEYLNCNGVWVSTDPILPGVRSPKLCVLQWNTTDDIVSDIKWYGDCIEGVLDPAGALTWDCPIVIPRLRSVKPGYDTPGCPADYFERISCRFAEALYKDVLKDRYGITTNCSSEEFDKWDIKKELLNLAAITNPDYDCPPILRCNDVCVTTLGFENCSTGSCHSYTITYQPNTTDTITYTNCTTTEITIITHVSVDRVVEYNICIRPGTPVIAEGFLEHVGDCEP